MEAIGKHAIVMGAGMGGLLAARVLSDAFGQVTVLERDTLPATAESRRGVPQGRHGHGLLPRGRLILDELFPGFTAEAVAAGAPRLGWPAFRAILGGGQLRRVDIGVDLLSTSRPFLEHLVRRRVHALGNVTIIDGCDVAAPLTSTSGDRITGVRALGGRNDGSEEAVYADLVVDAMGRAGRTRRWLDELGFPRPSEDEVRVDVTYVTGHVRLPEEVLPEDGLIQVGPEAGRLTGLYMARQEHGWWIVTAFGYHGQHPPNDPDAWLQFISGFAPADVVSALGHGEILGEITTHRLPSNLRRRYERLRRFPSGLLVFGDAICSFNPIYGQGMTVAALEAMTLRNELQRDQLDARRFYRTVARGPLGDAWDMATGSDLSLPEIEGRRPAKVKIINAYMHWVMATCRNDEAVARAMGRAFGMLDRPASLLRPPIAVRVLRHRLVNGRTAQPA
jgi:2-polyprenyl-6-methoxyphenol hydroxylase-like FAD-dependent oxidoreductase